MLDIGQEGGSFRQRAESIKMSDPGQTPKVLQVLFPRDVIEVDPPNHISN
jgi:hypothetical protein